MNLGLKSRVAIVTGGTRGIGSAIATELAREGAQVVICGRDETVSANVARSIATETSSTVAGFMCDVGSRESIQHFVGTVLDRFGRIDILVNNAGTHVRGTIDDYDESEIERHFREKVFGFMRMIRQVAPAMRKQRDGRIVNVIGPAGRHPHPDRLASAVVNAGVFALTKGVADALAGDNIRVNTVSPQAIEGELIERIVAAEMKKHEVSRDAALAGFTRANVLGRLGKPEEVAAVVAFLVSDPANFICGSTVAVDGGYQRYTY